MRRWVFVVCAGCGRLGFDATTDDVIDAAIEIDASRPDAPDDALTMTFTPVADTYIVSEAIERLNNFGAEDELRTKRADERGLLRFDVAQLPATATIVFADLEVTPTSIESDGSFRVHPMREAWTEGTQEGAPGACNWDMRTLTLPWTNAGASTPTSAGSIVTTFTANGLAPLSIALPPSLVEGWVDQPSTNFGIVLMAVGDNEVRFSSREGPATDRPKLVVTYLP